MAGWLACELCALPLTAGVPKCARPPLPVGCVVLTLASRAGASKCQLVEQVL